MLLVMDQSPAVVTIGTQTPASSSGTLRSAPFGDFDPAHPCLIPGLFAANILTEPLDIEAPAELTWKIMVDFDRYPEWNPINRFFRLDSHAAPGQTVTFGPRWGPYDADSLGEAGFTQHETLTVWEENRALAYGVVSWWLNAERVQHLAPLAANRCRYYTYERTSGVLSPLVRRLYGRRIVTGFTANGLALKRRAEEQHLRAALGGR
jgi:hypothetical protein